MKPLQSIAILSFGIALVAVAPSAVADEKVQGRAVCQDIGSLDNGEKLGDKENHAIGVENYSCVEEEGPLKGAILSGHNIIEWDGATGTILSGDGVTRMAGPADAWKAIDGKITLIFKDGKVVDLHAEGHNQIIMATGALASNKGKTVSWTSKPLGPGRFEVEFNVQ